MEEEFKTSWGELQEAYARVAYLRLKICEKTGELKRLGQMLRAQNQSICDIENKIVKENEEADKI